MHRIMDVFADVRKTSIRAEVGLKSPMIISCTQLLVNQLFPQPFKFWNLRSYTIYISNIHNAKEFDMFLTDNQYL